MSGGIKRDSSITASQKKRRDVAEFESGIPVLLNVRRVLEYRVVSVAMYRVSHPIIHRGFAA